MNIEKPSLLPIFLGEPPLQKISNDLFLTTCFFLGFRTRSRRQVAGDIFLYFLHLIYCLGSLCNCSKTIFFDNLCYFFLQVYLPRGPPSMAARCRPPASQISAFLHRCLPVGDWGDFLALRPLPTRRASPWRRRTGFLRRSRPGGW